ncbi:unnamed protein product [Porites evermanni]|uniref:Uncharacterized protein n=1 Tax=Porites evermanni TaxID=104178 RepID=A0ABN8SRC4_9CNID|nr:unnamed protein product [Porites evermanni]
MPSQPLSIHAQPRQLPRPAMKWQSRYMSLKSKLGDEIVFTQGLPDMSENLSDINPNPSDRKHIGIVAERIFDKNRTAFMSAYTKETEKSYGYVLIDNQLKTTTDKQVVADVFGTCHCYPYMITSTKTLPEETLSSDEDQFPFDEDQLSADDDQLNSVV